MSGYWSRFFVMFAVAVFVLPLFAADKNFSDYNEHTYYTACEHLLDANLSGNFVVTDVKSNRSQLLNLKRLGASSAYVISTAKMDMPAQGIRELAFTREPHGWLIGDPHSPERQVNVLSLERAEGTVHFKMSDVSDPHEFTYQAVPHDDVDMITGADILNPDGWVLNMQSPYEAQYRFTRVRLDRIFEKVVGQALKGQLADRSENGQMGFGDNIIIVEAKMPLNVDEASRMLGTTLIYPISDNPNANANDPTYKFAVPKNLYTLLESIGQWTRIWQIAHIDSIPIRMLNPDLAKQIVRAVAGTQMAPSSAGSLPAQQSPPSDLDALNRISGSLEAAQRPRDLDAMRTPLHDDDEHNN